MPIVFKEITSAGFYWRRPFSMPQLELHARRTARLSRLMERAVWVLDEAELLPRLGE